MTNLSYLSNHSNFNSVEEMDKAIKLHTSANWHQLNDTDRAVLTMISRYSVKHGAAHLKHETIAKSVNKSISTIRRSLKKLEALEIIKNVKFIRKVLSGFGANIYTVLPFIDRSEQAEVNNRRTAKKPTTSTVEASENENEPIFLKTNTTNNTKGTVDTSTPDDKSHLKAVLPSGWYEQASTYATNAQDLYTITGELYKAKKGTSIKIEDYTTEFGQVLRQAWFNLKHGRINANKWYAYLFAAFRNTAKKLERQQQVQPILADIAGLFDVEYVADQGQQDGNDRSMDALMALI